MVTSFTIFRNGPHVIRLFAIFLIGNGPYNQRLLFVKYEIVKMLQGYGKRGDNVFNCE